ncbi:hypothetical protein J1N35_044230 [Gossypium stocksii]|uniref:Uncharacterized protein n=1 Tax=Gossypium stocksii TaxID=47602 RepID=A0A9D3U946_9ROSI|nr:hypothetical protein J1N35_044230 [Gossypium stocksii]
MCALIRILLPMYVLKPNFEQAFGFNTPDNMALTHVTEKRRVSLLVILTGEKEKTMMLERPMKSIQKLISKSDHIMVLDQRSWHGGQLQIRCLIGVSFKSCLKIIVLPYKIY